MSALFLAFKKLTGRDIVRVASRHNLREIQAEIGAGGHIDASRMALNQTLAGPSSAADVAALAGRLMEEAGAGTLRKDAVRAVEVLFSLPGASSIDPQPFFAACLAWSRDYFKAPVLSAVIHLDEAAPHCHVLLLPLINGRMAGSDLVGNRTRLQAIQTAFFEQVGRRHGLTRPKPPKRLSATARHKAASLAFTAIVSDAELLQKPKVEAALLEMFSRNPEPLLLALGIPMPDAQKPVRSFIEIMTKPCKTEPKKRTPIGFGSAANPIGFASLAPDVNQTLSCVGFGQIQPPVSLPEDHAADQGPFTRSREDGQAEHWDGERGEFRQLLEPRASVRDTQVIREIEQMLAQVAKRRSAGAQSIKGRK